MNFPIDYVFPYVDNKKEQWRDAYKKFCIDSDRTDILYRIDTERYDDLGLLKFVFRGIDKFMPWIRKIHLIVSDEDQVPDWLDKTKVNIVKHKDIIPEQYLPTYNSTTIEMFLHKIPNLAEHFIYANDDIYPIADMKPGDFFSENGKPKLALEKHQLKPVRNQFDQVCYNSYKDVAKCLLQIINDYEFICPQHGLNPLLRSHCIKCFTLLGNIINTNISPIRTAFNHNQYIYTNYAYLTRDCEPSKRAFCYAALRDNVEQICDIIKSKDFTYICLNDTGATDRELFHSNKSKLEESFLKINLDKRSKYEV